MDCKRLNYLFLALAFTLTGCATDGRPWYKDPGYCALMGAPVGAGVGIGVSGDGDDDDRAVGIGAGVGALLGATICALAFDEGDGMAKDTDGDGVPDNYDECPDTPAGYPVDERGCSDMDYDRDGVPDSRDQCPNTPLGETVDSNGCTLDSDGDGVPDSKDLCPGTPAGVEVNSTGCPLDTDGDGVEDYKDQCPNTPPGTKVNEIGCEDIAVLEGVQFEFNSATLKPESRATLDRAVSVLKNHPSVEVLIVGHTDSVGSASYNQILSAKRAESVRAYMVSHGISGSLLSSEGRGETQPVADNATDAGRQKNRRVELHVVD